ncbi:hypothetical protein EGW08_009851 [Elysia chlorotica]|uniref:Uncharacterized protein n=1 Tax=Elysia chlorotica TaxID=188477 RepID=A0A3S1BJL8_ELYCH|nr:hypothetical protein EGW08_009851 [Elysia chlorotica]
MALRDLFTTAWLVTLLVMASGATGLVQNESLSVPTAHDSSSTFSVMLKLERLEAKIDSLEKRSAIDNDAIQNNMLKKTDLEEILTRIIMLAVTTEEGFSFLKENVENSWQQPQLDTEESAFQNVANKLNYTLSKKVQSALIQFFSPSRDVPQGTLTSLGTGRPTKPALVPWTATFGLGTRTSTESPIQGGMS